MSVSCLGSEARRKVLLGGVLGDISDVLSYILCRNLRYMMYR